MRKIKKKKKNCQPYLFKLKDKGHKGGCGKSLQVYKRLGQKIKSINYKKKKQYNTKKLYTGEVGEVLKQMEQEY